MGSDKLLNRSPYILFVNVLLMRKNPLLISPENSWILLCNAMSNKRSCPSPVVDRFKGKVLKDEAHILAILLDESPFIYLGHLSAVWTLKITENINFN